MSFKNNKEIIDIVLIGLAVLACISSLIAIYFIAKNVLEKRSTEEASEEGTADQEEASSAEAEEQVDETALYPNLEEFISLTLLDVKTYYPGGRDIESKTTWGTIYHSYEYENDLFILIVDAKDTGIIDSTILIVKKFTGCKMDETVLDVVDEILPYAGFDPTRKGEVQTFGVSTGVASYYDYKEGYVLGVQCYFTPTDEAYYEVYYFNNPNSQESRLALCPR